MKPSTLLKHYHWTRYTVAKDIDGNRVRPKNPRATSFCIIGAAIRCGVLYKLRKAWYKKYNENAIADWNDYAAHSKKQVIARLKSLGL
jgi:hypothetical protein